MLMKFVIMAQFIRSNYSTFAPKLSNQYKGYITSVNMFPLPVQWNLPVWTPLYCGHLYIVDSFGRTRFIFLLFYTKMNLYKWDTSVIRTVDTVFCTQIHCPPLHVDTLHPAIFPASKIIILCPPPTFV